MHRLLATLTVAAGVLFAVAPAKADLMFTLNQQACTGTCAPGPFGTVTLSQINSTTVGVTVALLNGAQFVQTGAGDALTFNIQGNPHIAVDLTASPGFALDPTTPVHSSAFGFFDYGVECTTGCGSGGSNPNPGPLVFKTTDGSLLSINNFVSNGTAFFASDIISGNGATGNVGTNTPGVTINPLLLAPEPASLALLGFGLVGLGLVRARR